MPGSPQVSNWFKSCWQYDKVAEAKERWVHLVLCGGDCPPGVELQKKGRILGRRSCHPAMIQPLKTPKLHLRILAGEIIACLMGEGKASVPGQILPKENVIALLCMLQYWQSPLQEAAHMGPFQSNCRTHGMDPILKSYEVKALLWKECHEVKEAHGNSTHW